MEWPAFSLFYHLLKFLLFQNFARSSIINYCRFNFPHAQKYKIYPVNIYCSDLTFK